MTLGLLGRSSRREKLFDLAMLLRMSLVSLSCGFNMILPFRDFKESTLGVRDLLVTSAQSSDWALEADLSAVLVIMKAGAGEAVREEASFSKPFLVRDLERAADFASVLLAQWVLPDVAAPELSEQEDLGLALSAKVGCFPGWQEVAES